MNNTSRCVAFSRLPWAKAMKPRRKNILMLGAVSLVLSLSADSSLCQARDLQSFFRQDVELSQEQIADLQAGKAIAKAMPPHTPGEVFLFGAVYIHAIPESYVTFRHDFDRLAKLPGYLSLGVFRDPPSLSDLKGFDFDADDIHSLRNCKPGACLLQLPEGAIRELQESTDWSGARCGRTRKPAVKTQSAGTAARVSAPRQRSAGSLQRQT